MADKYGVAVIIGSLRKEAHSRKVAQALMVEAPASLGCRIVEIGDLSLFNQDLESQPPESWTRMRSEIKSADAVLFVTPEYNRSTPGVLKNAVDIASRPPGQSVLDGMPAAVVSVTPYNLGGLGANQALRQSFVWLNMPALQKEAYLSKAGELFDEQGRVKGEDTRKFFREYMEAFAQFIAKIRRAA
jgi:chromate reductase, NAD(P)H dehydrogenase (quinone)